MAFVHSKNTRIVVGVLPLSCYLRSLEHSSERELADVTVFCDDGHKFIRGLDNGSLSLGGLLEADASQGKPDDVLNAARNAASGSVITIGPDGLTVGKRVLSIEARESSYTITSEVADAVQIAAEWQAEGGVDVGVSLHDLAAEDDNGNGQSVNNGASSAGGGIAALHVVSNSRDGDTTIRVQHSADDSTYADLVTFTTVGASTTLAERKTVNGTVNQYLRVVWALDGSSGEVSFVVAFCRR